MHMNLSQKQNVLFYGQPVFEIQNRDFMYGFSRNLLWSITFGWNPNQNVNLGFSKWAISNGQISEIVLIYMYSNIRYIIYQIDFRKQFSIKRYFRSNLFRVNQINTNCTVENCTKVFPKRLRKLFSIPPSKSIKIAPNWPYWPLQKVYFPLCARKEVPFLLW